MAALRNWKMGSILNFYFDKEKDGSFFPNLNSDEMNQSLLDFCEWKGINLESVLNGYTEGDFEQYHKDTGKTTHLPCFVWPYRFVRFFNEIKKNQFYFNYNEKTYSIFFKNIDDIGDDKNGMYIIDLKSNPIFMFFEKPDYLQNGQRRNEGGRFIMQLNEKVIKANKENGLKIIIANIEEGGGPIDFIFENLYKNIEHYGLIADKIHLIHGNHAVIDKHENFCRQRNIQNRIHTYKSEFVMEIVSHSFPKNIGKVSTLGYVMDNITPEDLQIIKNTKRKYNFSCLNRLAMKPHRFYFLSKMHSMGILEDIDYSMLFPKEDEIKYNDFNKVCTIEDFNKIIDSMEYIKSLGMKAMEMERTSAEKLRNFFDVFTNNDIQVYSNSYISIVNETCFDDNEIHLTEKTAKPLYYMQPFIILSGPGHLKNLRERGYKTFGEFWDESYDEEENPILRMKKITNLIESLNNKDLIHEIFYSKKMLEILKHNKVQMIESRKNYFCRRILLDIANN